MTIWGNWTGPLLVDMDYDGTVLNELYGGTPQCLHSPAFDFRIVRVAVGSIFGIADLHVQQDV